MKYKILILTLSIIGGLSGLLWYVSPIFKPFPKPTGKFSIGTTIMEFPDPSRKEIYSEKLEDKRTLVVRFFYPADAKAMAGSPAITSKGFERYSYLGDKMPYIQEFIANHYHLTKATSKLLLRNINTHSFINAPIATEQSTYPVILFSHGLLGYPIDIYLTILENLASHGYIVAAIDHPYFNALTLYASGKVASSLPLSDQFNRMSQKEQKEFQTKAIDVYKADMKFVLDEIAKLNENQSSIFYHHLDLNRIAAMGHSAGGTASIEFCRSDSRCKAAIDLDGWYDQVIGQDPIDKPLLLMFGSKSLEVIEPTPEYLKRKELTREQYFEREKNIDEHRKKLCSVPNCSFVVIPDATHGDFGDEMFIKWPLRGWNEVDAYKTIHLINGNILKFSKFSAKV